MGTCSKGVDKTMRDTADEMADILSVLKGEQVNFGSAEGVTEKSAQQIADIFLGKDSEKEEKEAQDLVKHTQLELERLKQKQLREELSKEELELVQQEEIKRQKQSALFEELENGVAHVIHYQSVSYYSQSPQPQGFVGKIMGKIRSATQRFLEFIFAPILEQQNTFNSWTARSLEANDKFLRDYANTLRQEYTQKITELEARNQILMQEILEIRNQEANNEIAKEKGKGE